MHWACLSVPATLQNYATSSDGSGPCKTLKYAPACMCNVCDAASSHDTISCSRLASVTSGIMGQLQAPRLACPPSQTEG